MTFLALLTKELRLSLRRERTVWVIIAYILLMGLLGWFSLNAFSSSNTVNGPGLSNVGINLYYILSIVQLFLLIFITPAFTSTTVNGEKERQTFDMLLCSQLSSLSLVSGKLLAGLMNALLLIAASVPLFSLVFFFGGISPAQLLIALVIYVVTTIMIGTFGLLCSTVFRRPAASTAIAYMSALAWLVLPLIVFYIILIAGTTFASRLVPSNRPSIMFIWNPVYILITTFPSGANLGNYTFANLSIPPWIAYISISIIAALLFFLLSLWTIKPNPLGRLSRARRMQGKMEQHTASEEMTISALQ
ncbi:MAG TPA: ABC transporter permease [Ktedonosporobacter sp.]|jgi:ABC-type transport system involved in multi-copper enzyme maturation permease subunit|nr:ABC transporter permease [Ktedonosporobacter sp.]